MAKAKSKGQSKVRSTRRGKQLPKGPLGVVELLLVQSVEYLGKPGDVVAVKRGYAMNYLLPQGLATVASEHHKRMVDKHKARLMEIQKTRLAGLQKLADQLGQESISIEANANDEGHLYGSVGAPEIVNALKRNNVTVVPEQVRLKGPLKELGLYTVKIHVGHEIEADLKVWVVPVANEQQAAEPRASEQKDAEHKDAGQP